MATTKINPSIPINKIPLSNIEGSESLVHKEPLNLGFTTPLLLLKSGDIQYTVRNLRSDYFYLESEEHSPIKVGDTRYLGNLLLEATHVYNHYDYSSFIKYVLRGKPELKFANVSWKIKNLNQVDISSFIPSTIEKI